MPVWIFQDARGSDLAAKLRGSGVGSRWTWKVDRYFRRTNATYISPGDTVLLWQPRKDDRTPAGIYGVAAVVDEPRLAPNDKTNWQVDLRITTALTSPLTLPTIRETPALQSLQIARMAGGHMVFRVTPEEWDALQSLAPQLSG
jgi:predicted RNA-binding protein with PUA-like domain